MIKKGPKNQKIRTLMHNISSLGEVTEGVRSPFFALYKFHRNVAVWKKRKARYINNENMLILFILFSHSPPYNYTI